MFDSASVNSISSIPSEMYQERKAFRLNVVTKLFDIRYKGSIIEVELIILLPAIRNPFSCGLTRSTFTLSGIQ